MIIVLRVKLYKSTPIGQHRQKPIHHHLLLGYKRLARYNPVILQHILDTRNTLVNTLSIPADAPTEFGINSRNPLIGCRSRELTFGTALVENIANAKHLSHLHTRAINALAPIHPHAHLVNHRPASTLVQINTIIGLQHRIVK